MKALSDAIDVRSPEIAPDKLPAHVVMLTGFLAKHRMPVYLELARRIEKLTILLSTPMEPNRKWKPEWEGLDVTIQKTWTLKRPRRHTLGFEDWTYVHVPWDTVGRLRKLKPDVVLSSELGLRSLFSAVYATVFGRVPLVLWTALSEHTEKGKGWARHLLRKRLVRRAQAAIVNGNSGAKYLQRIGIAPENIYRIHYSCLPGLFDGWPAERDAEASSRLLFVGRLIELKGVIPFLEALGRWAVAHPDRKVEFVLAGSGPLQGQIEAFAMPGNVTVRMVGECNYERVSQMYREAGIFVFPTLADDWGMSVNEAMTAGLPVLGSVYSQAVSELCADGTTGWTYRTNVPGELDEAIASALSTPHDRLNEMRRAARQRVAAFTHARGAEDVLRALRAVVGV